MSDPNPLALSLEYGGDFELTDNGSLKMVSGKDKLRQRVVRRYFTNSAHFKASGDYVPAQYIMHQDYGLSALSLVGEPMSEGIAAEYRKRLRQAALDDEDIDSNQEPEIQLYGSPDGTVWAKMRVFLLIGEQEELIFRLAEKNLA